MIITKLVGGLGNQMFQYATGRNVAYRLETELKLDISELKNDKLRKYELMAFNIVENFASTSDVRTFVSKEKNLLTRLAGYFFSKPYKVIPKYIKEKHFHFDKRILDISSDVYLDGYWQSENYFKEIEQIIRDEFTVKTPQINKIKRFSDLITSCESVSLHFRRGDYIKDPNIFKRYGSCDMAYYYRAIEDISMIVKNPHFFVFSDDLAWVRENFKTPYTVTFVEHNNASFEDLRLMTQCKHNIIANSSFSWWGAWLNNTPDKLVYAPKRWLKDISIAGDYNDFLNNLLPADWIKL